jgi:hypothetical protein
MNATSVEGWVTRENLEATTKKVNLDQDEKETKLVNETLIDKEVIHNRVSRPKDRAGFD